MKNGEKKTMPKKKVVEIWNCDWCGGAYKSEENCTKHEKVCSKNTDYMMTNEQVSAKIYNEFLLDITYMNRSAGIYGDKALFKGRFGFTKELVEFTVAFRGGSAVFNQDTYNEIAREINNSFAPQIRHNRNLKPGGYGKYNEG